MSVPRLALLGREREIDRVMRSLEQGERAATPVAAVIVGEPGLGKTALLDEVVARALAGGWSVCRLGSTVAEQSAAWSGLTALLADVSEVALADLHEDQLAALGVARGDRRDDGSTAGTTPMVAAAVRTVLRSMAAGGPTLVAIDDLQWMDPATASAVASALRTVGPVALAVVSTCRPMTDPPLDIDRLFGDRAITIRPTPLERGNVLQVLRAHGVSASVPMLDDVMALGGGNPLHTILLAEQIAIDGWVSGRLPTSIVASFDAMFDRLGAMCTDVLNVAAVHGAVVPDVLVACLPDHDVEDALVIAERAGLIVARGGDIDFRHPSVPAVLLDRLGGLGARRLHRALAAVLPERDEQRAVHLAASTDELDPALAEEIELAAMRALDRGARHVAAGRFVRAAGLTSPADVGDRWRRMLAAADAYLGAGDLAAAEEPSVIAFQIAGDPVQLALAGGARAQLLASRGDLVGTHRFVSDLLERLSGWSMLRAFLGRAKVRLEQTVGLHTALETAVTMRAEMEAAGMMPFVVEFDIAAISCRFLIGEPVDAVALWRQAEPIVDATDFISAGWMALEVLVWSGQDPDLAVAALDRFEDAANGAMQSLAKLHDFRANLHLRSGRWAEGEAEMRRAVDLAELSEASAALAHTGLAWVLAGTGRIDEARRSLAEASLDDVGGETPLLVAGHASAAGFVELCAGEWEHAATALGRAWDAADKMGMGDLCAMPFRVDLVEALVRCGRTAEASERARTIVELAGIAERDQALVQAARATTLVAAATGRLDEAVTVARQGLDIHRRLDVPIERGRLQLALGSALRRLGKRQEAAEVLRAAMATFGALGAAPFLRRANDELDRLGAHRRPSNDLTPAETQIARFVADGHSNAEAAAELVVSLRTIEAHLTRIYRKLGIRSRAQLAARFREETRAASGGEDNPVC